MESTWLIHHGIKGQKWGVRRYQNPDGTLTESGKKRYQKGIKKLSNAIRDYESTTAYKNYSRLIDPKVSSLTMKAFENDQIYYSNKGKKIIEKMKKDGLLDKNKKWETYLESYERQVGKEWLDNFGRLTDLDFEKAIINDTTSRRTSFVIDDKNKR